MTATSDHAAFMRTIIENPDSDDARLVYADWLEENGEPARAEFVRVQVELAKKVRCEWRDVARGMSCHEYNKTAKDYRIIVTCPACKRGEALACRERELWGYLPRRDGVLTAMQESWPGWAVMLDSDAGRGLTDDYPWAFVRRGFVESVRLSWADWLAHHAAITAATPLTAVRLTSGPVYQATRIHDVVTCWMVGLHGERQTLTEGEFEAAVRDHGTCGMWLVRRKWPEIDFHPPEAERDYPEVDFSLMFGADLIQRSLQDSLR